MIVGLGLGALTCDVDGNCYDDSTGVYSTPANPGANLCTTAACMMTGTPLPTNPLTGQPSASLAQIQNSLSTNSSWIVPAVAIGGLLLALLTGKKR